MSQSSQADRQADRLVILPSYLSRVEQRTTFCCRTVNEKNKKKRTEAQSISQEIVIPYVIDFHGILTVYCTHDTASTSLYTHEDIRSRAQEYTTGYSCARICACVSLK